MMTFRVAPFTETPMYEYVYEYVKICTHFYIHRDSELQCNPRKNWEYVEEYAEIPEKKSCGAYVFEPQFHEIW